MDIFGILGFLGGLALFLYGMKAMGDGLETVAGGRLEGLVSRLCSKTWRGVLVGAVATAAVQSSSAVTVMVIGFVNSGIMKLSEAVGVIMGANLGTTVTSWILSLTGIEGDNIFVRLLKPSSLAPVLALIGVVMIMRKKQNGRRSAGVIFAGLGILFFGMEMMSTAVEPLADNPEFASLLTLFESPIAGLLAGLVLTAIVQSSSASVGILQALAAGGGVSYAAAIPIVMGQNIGTCVTALLSSIGASKNAKRAAFVHLYFNIIGTVILLTGFYGLNSFLRFEFYSSTATAGSIAVIHTAFNLLSTLILLPFAGLLRRLAELTVREDGERKRNRCSGAVNEEYRLLDERFLLSPATALTVSRTAFERMLELARDNFLLAAKQFEDFDSSRADKLAENERLIDSYQRDLSEYMVKLAGRGLGEEESRELTKMMYDIGDVERIGDHAEGVARAAEPLGKEENTLAEEVKIECRELISAVCELVSHITEAQDHDDLSLAREAISEEKRVCSMGAEMKRRHFERLMRGEGAQSAVIFYDILNACCRAADHCANIAESILRVADNAPAAELTLNSGGWIETRFEERRNKNTADAKRNI